MTGLSVFNLDWSGVARSRDIEKAAEKVVKAIADEGKNSQKIIESVKTGSEKIVDAVSKVKIGNAATSIPAASAISTGLHSIAESANRIADYVAARPNELQAAAESAKAINRQFSDLVDTASEYAESASKLRAAATETVKASDWIGNNYPSGGVSVNNSCGLVADMAVFNFR